MYPIKEHDTMYHFWMVPIEINCWPAGSAAHPTRHMAMTKPPDQNREGLRMMVLGQIAYVVRHPRAAL